MKLVAVRRPLAVVRSAFRLVAPGQPIKARQCGDIGAAYLYATTPFMFTGASETAFNRVRDAVRTPEAPPGADGGFMAQRLDVLLDMKPSREQSPCLACTIRGPEV